MPRVKTSSTGLLSSGLVITGATRYGVGGQSIASYDVVDNSTPQQRLDWIRSFLPPRLHEQWDKEITELFVDVQLKENSTEVFGVVVVELRSMRTMKALKQELMKIPGIGHARAQALCYHPLRYQALMVKLGTEPKLILSEYTKVSMTRYFNKTINHGWSRESIRNLRVWAVNNIENFESNAREYALQRERRHSERAKRTEEILAEFKEAGRNRNAIFR